MAIELNEDDYGYNIDDVVITLNGLPVKGIALKDNCVRFKYNEKRYTVKEYINKAIIGTFTNSKLGTCEIDTYILSKLFGATAANHLAKSLSVIIVSIPNRLKITLSAAGVSDLGTLSIGPTLNENTIEFTGRLDILPIGFGENSTQQGG